MEKFLHVEAQDQLSSLEEKMKSSEITMVSVALGLQNTLSWLTTRAFLLGRVTNVTDCPQEVYIAKVKALLGKELHLENGSHVDAEQNGKTNGLSNGSHKDEEGEDVTMDVQEGEEADEAVKSPTASKGKGGRKSKGNSDTKSMLFFFPCANKY